MKKSSLFILVLSALTIGLLASCQTRCYDCIRNDNGEVGGTLCTDDPIYSTNYFYNWRDVCVANDGHIEERIK